ncbi:MAG: cadherin-like beta sandwich domain-containing protein [Anaerofustis sp.]
MPGKDSSFYSSNGRFICVPDDNANLVSGSVTVLTITFVVNSSLSAGTTFTVSANSLIVSEGTGNPGSTSVSRTISAASSGSTGTSGSSGSSSSGSSGSSGSTTINKSGSSDATLKALSVAEAELSPAFSASTTEYSLSVPFEVAALTVTATQNDSKASVSVQNNALAAGKTTQVSVVVTAENGTTKTYVINAARAQDPNYVPSSNNYLASIVTSYGTLSPTFDKTVTHYAMNVPYDCTSVTFTAAPEDPLSTCVVLGDPSLAAGIDNLFFAVVTAEDQSTRIYYITVRRAQDYNAFVTDDYTQSIIDQISQQTDPVIIDMSKSPVQILSSKILSALKQYPNMVLIIDTINGKFTITGSDLTGDITDGFYDFTINNSSQYYNQMISDAANGINYVFSTHYTGAFPGTVEYTIYTNFTTGTSVNVYQYDSENAQYIAVAKNLTSQGGAVSFRYDQGGDFLITTDTISNAVNSSFITDQSLYKNDVSYTMMFAAAGLFLIIGFGAGMIFGKLKKKPKPPKPPKTPISNDELPNPPDDASGNQAEEQPEPSGSTQEQKITEPPSVSAEPDNPADLSALQMQKAVAASVEALGLEQKTSAPVTEKQPDQNVDGKEQPSAEAPSSPPKTGAEGIESILDHLIENEKHIDS